MDQRIQSLKVSSSGVVAFSSATIVPHDETESAQEPPYSHLCVVFDLDDTKQKSSFYTLAGVYSTLDLCINGASSKGTVVRSSHNSVTLAVKPAAS